MDKEILWILNQLSAHEISAISAERILRALELMRKSKQGITTGSPVSQEQKADAGISQAVQESIMTAEDLPSRGNTEPTLQIKEVIEKAESYTVRSWDQTNARTISQCPECGTVNDPDAVFCNGCSARIVKSSPTSTELTPFPRLQHVKEQLRDRLPQYLANRLLEGSKEMQGRHGLATAMFVNLSGMAEMVHSMPLDQYVDTVDDCFRMMVDIIYIKYEGCISRVAGDNVLALFGAPIIHENDTERAISAALDICSGMEKLNSGVSIGINAGMIYMGEMDSDFCMECSSWDPDIDLANMIQDAANAGEIWVGMSAYRLTDRAFIFGEAASFDFRELEGPQIAYPVLGISDHPEMLREISDESYFR